MATQYSKNTEALGVGFSLALIVLIMSYFTGAYRTELLINAVCIGIPATFLLGKMIQLVTEKFPVSLVAVISKLLIIALVIVMWV